MQTQALLFDLALCGMDGKDNRCPKSLEGFPSIHRLSVTGGNFSWLERCTFWGIIVFTDLLNWWWCLLQSHRISYSSCPQNQGFLEKCSTCDSFIHPNWKSTGVMGRQKISSLAALLPVFGRHESTDLQNEHWSLASATDLANALRKSYTLCLLFVQNRLCHCTTSEAHGE